MTALESMVSVLTRTGSRKPWRVDTATYREMYAELEAWASDHDTIVYHDMTTGAVLVRGVPVSVWVPS